MNMIFDTVGTNTGEAIVAGAVMASAANLVEESFSSRGSSGRTSRASCEGAREASSESTENASQDNESTLARYHSLLAMEAARKMRRTRQKRKTGQEICHHLKRMLAEPLPETAPDRSARSKSQFQLAF